MELFLGITWMVVFGMWLYLWRKDKRVTSLIMTLCSFTLGVLYILQYGGIA